MRLALICTVFLTMSGIAQEAKAPAPSVPTLTTEQQLRLDTLQLRHQLAQESIARRQAEIVALQAQIRDLQEEAAREIASLQKPGYTFDVQTRTYRVKPAEKPEKK